MEAIKGTPRKCAVCQQPAGQWVYKMDSRPNKEGKRTINKSSRSPRCSMHAQIAAH